MAARQSIISGLRFHRFTTIREVEPSPIGHRRVLCRCDCGQERTVQLSNLRSGNSKSCGCFLREQVSRQFATHRGSRTRLYGIWTKIIDRTCNPSVPCYKRYGGRGIVMCDEWRNSYAAFRDWAQVNGYHDDLTIERKDVNGNYEPDNCTWIPQGKQAWNRRTSLLVTIDGRTQCLAAWAEEFGVKYKAVWQLVSRGRTPEEALQYRKKANH